MDEQDDGHSLGCNHQPPVHALRSDDTIFNGMSLIKYCSYIFTLIIVYILVAKTVFYVFSINAQFVKYSLNKKNSNDLTFTPCYLFLR